MHYAAQLGAGLPVLGAPAFPQISSPPYSLCTQQALSASQPSDQITDSQTRKTGGGHAHVFLWSTHLGLQHVVVYTKILELLVQYSYVGPRRRGLWWERLF